MMAPTCSKPLPQCNGPKLHMFKEKTHIEFVRLLSDINDDSESGGHAYVFEASIGGKKFALKVFKFYDDGEDRSILTGRENEYITTDLLRAHMDPFYNECRAYGRLIEGKVNGKVAVRCHGYTTISAEREEELEERFNVTGWNRPEEEYARPVARRQPFQAIVKDLISEDVPFNAQLAKKTLKDLKRMRRLGVYPLDITGRNYMDGLLVDMSIAMTKPHYLFEIKPKWEVKLLQRQDLLSWQSMMEEENVITWERAVRNPKYCKKLRSHKRSEHSDESSDEEVNHDSDG
ncbi:hypothetical protein P7C71_g1944, partial [Lecanoromycetidae sp. Uapishka_2]